VLTSLSLSSSLLVPREMMLSKSPLLAPLSRRASANTTAPLVLGDAAGDDGKDVRSHLGVFFSFRLIGAGTPAECWPEGADGLVGDESGDTGEDGWAKVKV
jgi:hypothetical protein